MNISSKIKTLPVKIGTYDLITEEGINAELTLSSLQSFFEDIKKGMLEESLVCYDNRDYQYSLRVCERGEELYLQFEYMKIVYDHLGPITAILEKKIRYLGNIETAIDDFIKWIEIHE